MNYAIIKNGVVVNVIVADSIEIVELIAQGKDYFDVTDSKIKMGYFLENEQWYPMKPDYDCQWYIPLERWLTNDEIEKYELNILSDSLDDNEKS